ncbi:MAG TPA: response regulator, partial [Chitinophagales bacterium]|nr:response regulator [Chitinophagales bacterium]
MESKSLETRKYHVLIVDKDKASIDTTIKAFKSENYKFTEITKTKDLVVAIKKEKPDLVILEVDLNEADGIEVCWDIRADVTLA